MKIIILGSAIGATANAVRQTIAASSIPNAQLAFIEKKEEYQPPTTNDMNFRSILPFLSLGLIGEWGSISPKTPIPARVIPRATARGGGGGGFNPKKTSHYTGYKRPSKSRRPQTQFARLNATRIKYNIWHESQLNTLEP